MTLFETVGGEEGLRAIIERFVDRVFDDLMIGFHFRDASRARVKAKEYEFAAQHLGAEVTYSGRPLRAAHKPHRILGGHFDRRLKILEEVFEELEVPSRVREHWLAHNRDQAAQILHVGAGPCDAGTGMPLPKADGP